MKSILGLISLALVLSGCALTPHSLALIPAQESVPIPPRYAQHLNALDLFDEVPIYTSPKHIHLLLTSNDCESVPEQIQEMLSANIPVLDADQMKSDRWLQLWAMTAMEKDGSLELRKTIEEEQNGDLWYSLPDYVIAVYYMNAFAGAELSCSESRMELAEIVEMNADPAEDGATIRYPRLALVHHLSGLEGIDCAHNLASLQELPQHDFCFDIDCLEEVWFGLEGGKVPSALDLNSACTDSQQEAGQVGS